MASTTMRESPTLLYTEREKIESVIGIRSDGTVNTSGANSTTNSLLIKRARSVRVIPFPIGDELSVIKSGESIPIVESDACSPGGGKIKELQSDVSLGFFATSFIPKAEVNSNQQPLSLTKELLAEDNAGTTPVSSLFSVIRASPRSDSCWVIGKFDLITRKSSRSQSQSSESDMGSDSNEMASSRVSTQHDLQSNSSTSPSNQSHHSSPATETTTSIDRRRRKQKAVEVNVAEPRSLAKSNESRVFRLKQKYQVRKNKTKKIISIIIGM